jgi:hypothetical protein
MKRRTIAVVTTLVALLVVSLGLNLYQFGRVNDLTSQVNPQWSEVRQGYVVINGTVFNERSSEASFGGEYTTIQFDNVTFTYHNLYPNSNGSQVEGFAISYLGSNSHSPWNATLGFPIFVDGSQNLPRADFTSGTTPIVGVVWGRDGYFHFLVGDI